MADLKPWGIPEIIGCAFAAVFNAAIPGTVVGILWSLALSKQIVTGAAWGFCIAVGAAALLSLTVSLGFQDRDFRRDKMFLLGGIIYAVNFVAGLFALVVWAIRAFF